MTLAFSVAQARTLAIEIGFDAAGIARPHSEALPAWVRSVLVCQHATLDEAFDIEINIVYDHRRKWYKPIYTAIESLSFKLAGRLEETGLRAMPLTFENSLELIDLKRAAVEAGLGVLGKNNLVVTKHYGPRVRFGAIFLDADWPASGPALEYYCPSCTLCWKSCPTQALGPKGFQRSECIAEFDPSHELAERQKKLTVRPTPCTRLQCLACITTCPIGSKLFVDYGMENVVDGLPIE